MKLTSSLTTIGLVAFSLCSCQENGSNQAKETPDNKRAQAALTTTPAALEEFFIPKDTANKMISSYLSSLGTNSSVDTPSVHSFILDADVIREYLSDTTIKNLKVMLAHTQAYINSGNNGVPAGYSSKALTIVLAGYNSAGNYVFAPGNKVPDRAAPCPAVCPLTGTASNSLLQ